MEQHYASSPHNYMRVDVPSVFRNAFCHKLSRVSPSFDFWYFPVYHCRVQCIKEFGNKQNSWKSTITDLTLQHQKACGFLVPYSSFPHHCSYPTIKHQWTFLVTMTWTISLCAYVCVEKGLSGVLVAKRGWAANELDNAKIHCTLYVGQFFASNKRVWHWISDGLVKIS